MVSQIRIKLVINIVKLLGVADFTLFPKIHAYMAGYLNSYSIPQAKIISKTHTHTHDIK